MKRWTEWSEVDSFSINLNSEDYRIQRINGRVVIEKRFLITEPEDITNEVSCILAQNHISHHPGVYIRLTYKDEVIAIIGPNDIKVTTGYRLETSQGARYSFRIYRD